MRWRPAFVEHHYDLHWLIRTITASRTYQLSSEPNETNERDDQNYSRALLRRLDAEVLLDAICQATGVGEKVPRHSARRAGHRPVGQRVAALLPEALRPARCG